MWLGKRFYLASSGSCQYRHNLHNSDTGHLCGVCGYRSLYKAWAKRGVAGVEGKTYTEAVNILHKRGFKVDIRDSLYREDVKPGRVIEQFPKANSIVKRGRKIFLIYKCGSSWGGCD